MNVLLIGGAGTLINNLIIKLKKEGHRVCLLTGSRFDRMPYQKVFEKYNFTYDSNCLAEVFASVRPDVTIFMGAFDTNYHWIQASAEAVKYSTNLMNLLMSYAEGGRGRFIYLSSAEVYNNKHTEDILEYDSFDPSDIRGMVFAQSEELCDSYRNNLKKDIMVLRLDTLYSIPRERRNVNDICSKMCLEALERHKITVQDNNIFSLLYETDAIEAIYRVMVNKNSLSFTYNISSSREITGLQLAEMIKKEVKEDVEIITLPAEKSRRVLSNVLYESEFGNPRFCEEQMIVQKVIDSMKKNQHLFKRNKVAEVPLKERVFKKIGWLLRAMVPFVENLIAFIPFFMLNNRAAGSEHFARLDFYLLYVLLFAIVYGQQQACISAILAVAGFYFRQTYDRTGFEVMLDTNTYVWIAQLFILGLTVGYMRDRIRQMQKENEQEQEFLEMQLSDIQDINNSNVRVKDALETQIVNQNDSVGKIYSITSALEQYSPDEVLFYAAEIVATLTKSKDVAIYTISNSTYARLFSSTSKKARMLGKSIQYTQMGEVYEQLSQQKVYINRKMDERYPLMANAIFENDKMEMMIMIWGISWENMTLGQANQLVIISSLIQNAVLRANRYMSVLENQRYVEGTQIMETEAFTSLLRAYLSARDKGLTECTVLHIETHQEDYMKVAPVLVEKLRQSDYMGTLGDGELYALLSNTDDEDAQYVIGRFAEVGYNSCIVGNGEV